MFVSVAMDDDISGKRNVILHAQPKGRQSFKMAPKKRKKKTKQELKDLAIERGKKAASQRGKGVGSRIEMSLPSKWHQATYKRGDELRVEFTSPGKSVYKDQSQAKKVIIERGMSDCMDGAILASSSSSHESDTDEFHESSEETSEESSEQSSAGSDSDSKCVTMERRLFVCESTQLMDLVQQINETSRCSTVDCNGILVLAKVEPTGLGGTLNAQFVCNNCNLRQVNFQGSVFVEGSKRTVVGLALGVAFFISGHGFAKFEKTLRQFLGISCVSKNPYFEIVKLVYPIITDILDEQCNEEKERMKDKDKDVLGSWKKAVVTSDGVWHTRGYFSKNGSFIIKNYITGGLLWYGHKCMRGNDTDELYEGTSKSMEGVLADECYGQAKEERCNINTVWQDGDSSSALSVLEHFPNGKVYKCGGHVGRAHANNLKEMAKKKEFSKDYQKKYVKSFPLVTGKCHCSRHKKKCGCISEEFIRNAKINHFCILQQSKNAADYAQRMRALSHYHCRDIHEWKDGSCGFHTTRSCTCKNCDVDSEPKCKGKPYSTKCPLTCDFHWVAYQIECDRRADDAESIIHPEMGRGHSNQCEAHFNVLPHFRSKSQSLNRLHYMCSTNAGLCQGNMSWSCDVRGKDYHWVIDLYDRLGLPIIPSVVSALQNATVARAKVLAKQKTDHAKANRVKMKVARAEDQKERRKWLKRQSVVHSYGVGEDDDEEEDGDGEEEVADCPNVTVISGKTCRCGSKEHKRTTHRSCPLNTKEKN